MIDIHDIISKLRILIVTNMKLPELEINNNCKHHDNYCSIVSKSTGMTSSAEGGGT